MSALDMPLADENGGGVGVGSNLSVPSPYDNYLHCHFPPAPNQGETQADVMAGFPEVRASDLLQRVLYPVLLAAGTVGNVLSLAALGHLSERAWSTCLYLAVLCPVELAVLYIRCGGTWFFKVVGVNPFHKMMSSSDAMCKTFLFLLNLLQQLWPWLVVCLSVELLVATRFPFRTYRVCTEERARAAVLLLTILLVCLNLNYFWTWGLVEDQFCIYIEAFSPVFMDVIWPAISMAAEHGLPLLIVSVTFLISAVSLLRASRSREVPSYEPVLKRYFLDLRALEQLKHSALIVLLLFLMVKVFTFVVELIHALEARGVVDVPCEWMDHFQANLLLAQTIRDTCVYSFHSLKFFVYFALCASFRQQVLALGRKLCLCKRRSWRPSRQGRKREWEGEGGGGGERGMEVVSGSWSARTDEEGPEGVIDRAQCNSTVGSSNQCDVNGHYQVVEISKTTNV